MGALAAPLHDLNSNRVYIDDGYTGLESEELGGFFDQRTLSPGSVEEATVTTAADSEDGFQHVSSAADSAPRADERSPDLSSADVDTVTGNSVPDTFQSELSSFGTDAQSA